MSLTILSGGTVGVTGGTSKTFTETSKQVNGGKSFADLSVTDFRVRPNVDITSRLPVLQNGVWSRGKQTVAYSVPFITAAGLTVFNVFRIACEVHPEFPAANALALRTDGAQFAFDTDMANFWLGGGLNF